MLVNRLIDLVYSRSAQVTVAAQTIRQLPHQHAHSTRPAGSSCLGFWLSFASLVIVAHWCVFRKMLERLNEVTSSRGVVCIAMRTRFARQVCISWCNLLDCDISGARADVLHVDVASWQQASCHTVTAVVGAGVLGLPYAFSYLGWFFGIVFLLLVMSVSYYTSWQLAGMHLMDGVRVNRYRDLGVRVLGPTLGRLAIVPFQFMVMVCLLCGLQQAPRTDVCGQTLTAITTVQFPHCRQHSLRWGLSMVEVCAAWRCTDISGVPGNLTHCALSEVKVCVTLRDASD
jgi:uncharacterized membrane protein